MAYLPLILLILAALFCGITVLAIIIAIRSAREQRTTIFPIVREVEGVKAKRATIATVIFATLAALSIGGWVATQQDGNTVVVAGVTSSTDEAPSTEATIAPSDDVTLATADITADTPTAAPNVAIVAGTVDASVFSAVPTETSAVAIASATATATPTPPPTDTPAAADTPPPATTPSPTATILSVGGGEPEIPTPPPNASIGPIEFALDVSDRREAINPAESFKSRDAEKVYAVFPYSGMKNGLPVTMIWTYKDWEILRDDAAKLGVFS